MFGAWYNADEKSHTKDKISGKETGQMKKRQAKILIYIVSTLIMIGLIGAAVFGWRKGVFVSEDAMESMLYKAGAWAPLVFVVLQITQVIIPILPGGVSCAAGVVVFGAWEGFVYNIGGITIGSILAFYLARRYGERVVKFFVKEKTYDKYITWLERGKKLPIMFFLAIFFPGAPDDAICMIAGLTNMTWKRFLILFLIAKPFSISLYSFAYDLAGGLSGIYDLIQSIFP